MAERWEWDTELADWSSKFAEQPVDVVDVGQVIAGWVVEEYRSCELGQVVVRRGPGSVRAPVGKGAAVVIAPEFLVCYTLAVVHELPGSRASRRVSQLNGE